MAQMTRMQQKIYDYIAQMLVQEGYPPSVREIGAAVGLTAVFCGVTNCPLASTLLVLGIVFSTPGPEKLWNRIRGTWLGTVILAVLFWACVYCMSVATNDPFMYFSF